MRQTIDEQIVMENSKLQKLEREAHQWVQQALPNLEKVDNIFPQMKRLLDAAEEQNQMLGPNMEHIAFSEAYKVLQNHMEESIFTEEVLIDWPTHYGKVYHQTRQTRQDI